jgi:carbon monoxide dehydrogenase subunit G
MQQDFHETIQLTARPDAVWAVVSDIPTVLSWISIVEAVEEVEPGERFGVVLADKLGPFKLRADLNVVVGEREPGTSIRARGDGEDRQIGSRLIIEVALALEEREGSTQLDVSGSYEVTGRPASLGAGAIRKKAANILAEFFASARRSLAAVTSSGSL